MKKANVKKAAYIGFSDAWGDLVYDALIKSASRPASRSSPTSAMPAPTRR